MYVIAFFPLRYIPNHTEPHTIRDKILRSVSKFFLRGLKSAGTETCSTSMVLARKRSVMKREMKRLLQKRVSGNCVSSNAPPGTSSFPEKRWLEIT
jgi:hypothetical protein